MDAGLGNQVADAGAARMTAQAKPTAGAADGLGRKRFVGVWVKDA